MKIMFTSELEIYKRDLLIDQDRDLLFEMEKGSKSSSMYTYYQWQK